MKKVLIFLITFTAGCAFGQGKWWPKEVNIQVPAISYPSGDTIVLWFTAPEYTFEGNYRISSTQMSDSVTIVLYPITFNFILDTVNTTLNNFRFQIAVDINDHGNYHDTINQIYIFDHVHYTMSGDNLYVDDSSGLCMSEFNTAHGYNHNYLNGQTSEAYSFKSQADTGRFQCKLIFALEKPTNTIHSLSDNNPSSIKIYPNPSTGFTHAFCITKSASSFNLHIFDELGKDVMTVYDSILPEGKRDFSFKLPQGMYYVRMESPEGIITKKVVVE